MGMYNPPHPGKLIAEFMEDRSVTAVAKHLGVTRAALSRVINGKAGISAEMALRLSEAFGLRAEVWMSLQLKRDMWVASRKRRKKVRSLVAAERKVERKVEHKKERKVERKVEHKKAA